MYSIYLRQESIRILALIVHIFQQWQCCFSFLMFANFYSNSFVLSIVWDCSKKVNEFIPLLIDPVQRQYLTIDNLLFSRTKNIQKVAITLGILRDGELKMAEMGLT